MKLCLVPSHNQIAIDGEIRIVDLSGLTLPDVWAINWQDDAYPELAEVEYYAPRENAHEDLSVLRDIAIQAWSDGNPPAWDPSMEPDAEPAVEAAVRPAKSLKRPRGKHV